MLAGCTAAGIGALSLAGALTATGLPDPGPATTPGAAVHPGGGEIAAVLAVGSFLFAAFLVPPQSSGVLDAGGYRALRVGTVASGAWAGRAALLVPADHLRYRVRLTRWSTTSTRSRSGRWPG